MTEVRLAEDVLERLRERETRYDERAYIFVLACIEYLQSKLPARRHITSVELADGVREYALEVFGLLAPTVLRCWGVVETMDIGRIVFLLVDVGLLVTQPDDRIEDFAGSSTFAEDFDEWAYVWQGVRGEGPGGERRRGEVA